MNRAARRRLAKDQAKRTGAAPGGGATGTPHQNLQLGMAHHQAGRLEQAAELYQGILARRPDHADANHLLGVVAFQRGRGEDYPAPSTSIPPSPPITSTWAYPCACWDAWAIALPATARRSP